MEILDSIFRGSVSNSEFRPYECQCPKRTLFDTGIKLPRCRNCKGTPMKICYICQTNKQFISDSSNIDKKVVCIKCIEEERTPKIICKLIRDTVPAVDRKFYYYREYKIVIKYSWNNKICSQCQTETDDRLGEYFGKNYKSWCYRCIIDKQTKGKSAEDVFILCRRITMKFVDLKHEKVVESKEYNGNFYTIPFNILHCRTCIRCCLSTNDSFSETFATGMCWRCYIDTRTPEIVRRTWAIWYSLRDGSFESYLQWPPEEVIEDIIKFL